MVEHHQVGVASIDIDDESRLVTSRWPDGTELIAAPQDDEESRARATALGYEDVWAMTREHDLLHHVVATSLGQPASEHLYRVATGANFAEHPAWVIAGDAEERMVLLLQRVLNEGRAAVA